MLSPKTSLNRKFTYTQDLTIKMRKNGRNPVINIFRSTKYVAYLTICVCCLSVAKCSAVCKFTFCKLRLHFPLTISNSATSMWLFRAARCNAEKNIQKIHSNGRINMPLSTIPTCFWMPIIFSNLHYDCSNLLDMRNLQEQVKKAIC